MVPKAVRKQYLEVPAGEAFIGGDRIPVEAFFLSRSEVTNIAYREYTADLKRNGDSSALAIAMPDTAQWTTTIAFCEPLRVHYNSHPAYDNYPVVNVGQQAAAAYCTWLASKLNAIAPEGTSYVVRLPSRAEWVRAAQGSKGRSAYAWGGPYTRNSKGCFLANYRAEQGDTLEAAARFHDNADITAALTGTQYAGQKGHVFPRQHNATRSGQLVDRWGTPFWFHNNGPGKLEIRSAGPDKQLFTPDDIAHNPSPPGLGVTPESTAP